MSIAALATVWDHSNASGSRLLVMLALADSASEEGYCWPSIEHAMRKARLQKKAFLRAIDDLVATGEIEVWKYRSKGKGPERNAYQITVGPYRQFIGTMPDEIVDSLDRVPSGTRRRIPKRVRERIFARDGQRCLKCGGTEALTIDHIKPRSKGGTDEEENLQTLCMECNDRKGVREIDLRALVSSETPKGGVDALVSSEVTSLVSSETPTRARSSSRSVSGTVRKSCSGQAAARARTPRDDIWDALTAVCEIDATTLTTGEKSRVGKSVNELIAVGATALEIQARAARYRQKFAGAALTDRALTNHWSELGGRRRSALTQYDGVGS